ncbi:MAG: hypothetical protein ACHQNA_00315 [Acidimicrobiales bacterium]
MTGVTAGPRRRRRWPWVVGAVSIVAAGGLFLFGLELTLRDLDTYTADLTRGHGDFPAFDSAKHSTSYQSDGYHLAITQPGAYAPAGIKSTKAHTAVAVEIEATAHVVPPGAAFGPFCWEDPSHGYGLLIDGSGVPQLVQIMVESSGEIPPSSELIVLATGSPSSATPGQSHRLMLTCDTTGRSPTQLKGYVDNVKVIEASATTSVSEFGYTGIAGRTGDATPAEWSVATFWQKGPAAMPTG